jgi:RNA polymerase sigma-70 factor (ECF subfamily)
MSSGSRVATTDPDQRVPRSSETWDADWPANRADFERLVESFQDRIVRYAFRRLGDLHEAEEVAQEVFFRAYMDRAPDRSVTHLSAYLYRIASNLCTDLLRRRKKPSVSLEQAVAVKLPANQSEGLQTAVALEELRRVENLLRRIPRRQAEVIRLRVFDELRLAEIAEVVHCPLATVKARLRYGLEKLRRLVVKEREVS